MGGSANGSGPVWDQASTCVGSSSGASHFGARASTLVVARTLLHGPTSTSPSSANSCNRSQACRAASPYTGSGLFGLGDDATPSIQHRA